MASYEKSHVPNFLNDIIFTFEIGKQVSCYFGKTPFSIGEGLSMYYKPP